MILRILGDSDFVESVLEAAQETMERKYHLRVSSTCFSTSKETHKRMTVPVPSRIVLIDNRLVNLNKC